MVRHLTSDMSSAMALRSREPSQSPLRSTRLAAAGLSYVALTAVALLAACSPAEDCAATAAGCGSVQVQAQVAQVIVTPALDTINVGSSALKTASPRDVAGAVITAQIPLVRWSSSAPAVARADSLTGLVTALSVGVATITARAANSITGTASVVVKATGVIASISISPPNSSVQLGRQVTLVAAAKDASLNSVAATFRWASSNAGIAKVDSVTGVVTGMGVGAATITVSTLPATLQATTSVSTVASTSLVAELPRVFLNTTYVAPTGAQIVVPVGGNFQTALNNAQPGDEILLAPGGVYTGNFNIPAKTGNGVIHVRTNVPYSSLPAEGARMTPTIAVALNLAKIQSTNGSTVMQTAVGASNYRFIGLEVTVGSATALNSLIRLGDVNQTSLANVSTNLVFDRMYIHGTATNDVTRGFILSSASSAIIDSHISDCHTVGADAQTIVGWNGPGPYKIVNNYLEASSENINWGGSDPGVPQLVPSDIEVRHNHFFKPPAWNGGSPVWLIKNLYESKASRRVLIEGNIFQNNWQSGQTGFAMNFKSTNQGGACTSCITADQTIRYNYIFNSGGGIGIAGSPDPQPVDSTARRFVIQDNVLDRINIPGFNGVASYMQIIDGASDIIVDHNTFVSTGSMGNAVIMASPAISGLTFTNNIVGNTSFGVKGGGTSDGTGTLNVFAPGYTFLKNAMIGSTAGNYPANNFFPANFAAVGFTNFAGLNYALLGTSALKNAGTDGRDIGADATVVALKINGVIVP